MSLPEQLKQQIAAADDLAKTINAPVDQTPEEPVVDDSVEQTPEGTREPEVQPATETEPVQKNDAPNVDDENSETYAQRWRSLQGVYNATKRQSDELQSRISSMEQLIAQMQNAKLQEKVPTPSKHITEKDVSDYGEDMVEFARRVSREEIAPLAQAVQMLMSRIDQVQTVVPVVKNVAESQAKSAHEAFYERLTARIPDWRSVNENTKFHNWLLDVDPLSGLQRQTLLTDAHNNLDLNRVANIFDMGKEALGLATPVQSQASPTKKVNSETVVKLEKQIAPGRSSVSQVSPTQKSEKQWTRKDIADFFAAKLHGRYKGREAEAQAIERDIFQAQRDGRVLFNAA